MSDVDDVYEEFWKSIIEPDGEIDFEQVKKELFDYWVVIHEVSKAYCEITNGKFSKPNTAAEYIIEAVEEYYERLDDAMIALREVYDTLDQEVTMLGDEETLYLLRRDILPKVVAVLFLHECA